VTLAVVVDGGGPASVLRHLYASATIWAALAAGARQACLVGLLAGLLQAPLVFPAIESEGVTRETVDGLVSILTPLVLGGVVGRLRDQSRARAGRLAALLAVQRSGVAGGDADLRLDDMAERVRGALGAEAAGLVLSDGGSRAVGVAAGPAVLDEHAAAMWTLTTGSPVVTRDIGSDGRFDSRPPDHAPVAGLVLPLGSPVAPIGVLALQWRGDLGPTRRLAAAEMAMHLALVIDNARLALRQREFARELEDKVAAATESLRELDRAKSEFLSVVSHELRTPLTALQGFSELLLSRTPSPEQAARFLRHIHGEAQRLGRIVSELLDLSRIEAGRPETLRRDRVDLGALVGDNVELFAAVPGRHTFEWTPPDAPLMVHGGRDALDRIVKNLLSNAVKYSPRGGAVRIGGGLAAGEVDMVEIWVEDEGVGIPPEDHVRIWGKYVRVHAAETAGIRGLGLGLSMVQALAEGHGGRAEVQSEPGRGSRFRVVLPAGAWEA
jgi:signal transduction histidine kinase